MSTSKQGPLSRLARRLGLGKTSGGGTGGYAGCWACSQGRCGTGGYKNNACTCCRGNHTGVR